MTDWRSRAACYGTFNPDFFAGNGNRWASARAKAVCRSCPVTAECREYALTTMPLFGVFGGLTEKERRKVKRLRRAA